MYDTAKTEVIYLGQHTFSASKVLVFQAGTEETLEFVDVELRVSTTMAGSTSTPAVKVGTTTDDDAFLSWDLGTMASGNTVKRATIDAADSIVDPTEVAGAIPQRNTDLQVTLAAGVGTPGGVADVWLHMKRR